MTGIAPDLTIYIQIVAASIILLPVQVFIQAQAGTAEKGMAWTASPRDDPDNMPRGKFAGRVGRALDNYLQTLPAFLALALALTILGKHSNVGAIGALIWIGSGIAYIPLYYLGVPHLRSLVWLASIGGLIAMIAALF